jgi:site-specific DNA-methyltransferase (adenine-specific)
LRSFLSPYESILFAEHYGADGYAKGEAGYTAKVDELRGFVFEPLRAYLVSERDRAGVTNKQVNECLGTATNGSGMAGHYFKPSGAVQWDLPTRKQYNKLREALSNLNHGGEYLKREYEDLKREYEDLRRPFTVSADVPYTDVWTFKTVNAYKGKHPCEKPLDMLEHMIAASSRAGGVVLDSFMGTGNTGRAARKLGRDFIGIEKDEQYFALAEKRINEFQMELA